MTDRELKAILKSAYSAPWTDGGRSFIKKYQKRSRNLRDILINEFRYMGIKSAPAGVLLCAMFFAAARFGDASVMWIASSAVPVFSVVPMSLVFRAERYGMYELEAAGRFSLRFIRLIRMMILGIFSSAIILGGSIILKSLWGTGLLDIVMYMLVPYFASVWGGLLAARKWHGKEGILGVFGVGLATGMLPSIIRELRTTRFVPDYLYVLLLLVLLAAIVKESIIFINERSDMSWNLY